MQILDELIVSLPDETSSLTEALLKTKVLLHQLGRGDLAEWVNWELHGYPSIDAVPDYRVLNATVRGNVSNGFHRYPNTLLPIMHLSQDVRGRFENLKITDSISALEKLSSSDNSGLARPIALEFTAYFKDGLSDGYYIESAWSAIGLGQTGQLLTQVRSRLLDFLLELRAKVGDAMTSNDMKALGQSEETARMFNNAIFGDHATIMVGHGGSQIVVSGVRHGDIDSLVQALAGKGVSQGDTDELRDAIKADSTSNEVAVEKRGPKVREWIGKMMTKVAENSWNIELAIAANLLTDAINSYYGWR